jgi:tetratricopeptide (TPR) repeat protein
MNDSLYNPDSMSKEDIKTLFVARQSLLDELVTTIKTQPKGAGVQHLLIISPRGMGKTTMLLMTQFAVEDNQDLVKNWQAVRFPEESYDITDLADFWLKVLDYLDDKSLKPKIEEIESKYRNSEDLREAAWALIKDWSKQNKKQIVLLVDNFDMILDQIGSDNEQARLRDILMNDGTVMLIGCSPSYFHQIQDYGQPLYNFFKVFNLNDLKFPDIEELIRRRAEIDEVQSIEELLQKNRTRIKALETFTGGNPRLVLMLYRIITSSDITEIRNGLERLLDAVTPFYKDKTEKLPPQQRKIINEIAQYSLETNEGISPTEIAKRMRTTPNQVSSQLKRMSENGYVKALNIRGRASFYVISEPLYVIWSQMRFGRNAREKRNWLVQILKALFDVQEIQKEIQKLDGRVKKLKLDGRENKARGTLEYMICLMETNSNLIDANLELAVNSYLELNEISCLKEIVKSNNLLALSKETIQKLLENKLINKENGIVGYNEKYSKVLGYLVENNKSRNMDFLKKAIEILEEITPYSFNDADFFITKAVTYDDLDENQKALESINQALAIDKNSSFAWLIQGRELAKLDRKKEALKSINYSLELEPDFDASLEERISILSDLKKYKKAISDCDSLLKINPNSHYAWHKKALSLDKLHFHDEAFYCLNKAIETDSECLSSWLSLGFSLLFKARINFKEGELHGAKDFITQAIEALKHSKEENWNQIIYDFYLFLAKGANGHKLKELIRLTELTDRLFPIVCAIDYIETKDESLIEKLSPEIRLVVEETIKTLQMVAENKEGDSN